MLGASRCFGMQAVCTCFASHGTALLCALWLSTFCKLSVLPCMRLVFKVLHCMYTSFCQCHDEGNLVYCKVMQGPCKVPRHWQLLPRCHVCWYACRGSHCSPCQPHSLGEGRGVWSMWDLRSVACPQRQQPQGEHMMEEWRNTCPAKNYVWLAAHSGQCEAVTAESKATASHRHSKATMLVNLGAFCPSASCSCKMCDWGDTLLVIPLLQSLQNSLRWSC